MNLNEITPLVLTYNEQANIGRCLERLQWAERVVIIDSGSTDRTLDVCEQFTNANVIYRAFDSFASQCNAGLSHIRSEWVLSIDADYIIPANMPEILHALHPSKTVSGYRFPFRYCIYGKPLRTCLYPARTILYRHADACYYNDGHGHRVDIPGKIVDLRAKIDHDDRKPLSRWLDSQRKYAALEAKKLTSVTGTPGVADRLRLWVWPAAPATFLYTLFGRRLILDGWPGIFYVLQRTYAELLLSLELLGARLQDQATHEAHASND